jgi:hypothetical protein
MLSRKFAALIFLCVGTLPRLLLAEASSEDVDHSITFNATNKTSCTLEVSAYCLVETGKNSNTKENNNVFNIDPHKTAKVLATTNDVPVEDDFVIDFCGAAPATLRLKVQSEDRLNPNKLSSPSYCEIPDFKSTKRPQTINFALLNSNGQTDCSSLAVECAMGSEGKKSE